MRKLLASALAACVAAVPAVAFAAASKGPGDTTTTTTTSTGQRATLHRRADSALDKAIARAKGKRKAALKRKRDRELPAQQADTPQPTGSGSSGGGQASSGGTPSNLQAIAACESGGNPSAVGGGGQFRGKYQFDQQTWASVGGSGDPAAAPEAEQDKRAAMLLARSGSNPWPVCGN